MKTRYWVLILGAILAVSLALWLLPGKNAGSAQVLVDGELVRTVSLSRDESFRVETPDGYNVVTVESGRIAVTESDCPGHDCMELGWQAGGRPIVCLPHGLVIRFVEAGDLDSLSG